MYIRTLITAVACIAGSLAHADTFRSGGNMSLGFGGRYGSFGALLPDGTILIAGGFNGDNLASAEIYQPQTQTFTWTLTDLSAARGFGKTIVLPDARALLIGGGDFDESGSVVNVDIYDPAIGTLSPTGSMHFGRTDMMAVLLHDGRVLVAGGMASDGVTRLASAEIYDPDTQVFSMTGSMLAARDNGVAVTLPNGKVLITGGGRGDGVSFAEAELFDPATGVFTLTGSMSVGRDDATATLLPNGKVLIAGGANNDVPMGTADIYDPQAGTFAPSAATMPSRDFASGVLLGNGKVLVVGGQGDTQGAGDTGALADAVTYDYTTDSFTSAGVMAMARYYFPAILMQDGSVFLPGGYNDDGVVSDTEIYTYPIVDFIFADGFEAP
jgi:hypothetical protein